MIDRTMFPIQRRKLSRPQEILDAALSLFIDKGFAAARADDIALRVGVSKATLYLYCHSKEAGSAAKPRPHRRITADLDRRQHLSIFLVKKSFFD